MSIRTDHRCATDREDRSPTLFAVRSMWFSKRAIGLHITALVLIPTFLLLGRWQLHRALSGNTLSWAYTFEWPIFAIYGVYMWWKLVHERDDEEGTPRPDNAPSPPARDEELEAYNAYLASLHAETNNDLPPPTPSR